MALRADLNADLRARRPHRERVAARADHLRFREIFRMDLLFHATHDTASFHFLQGDFVALAKARVRAY